MDNGKIENTLECVQALMKSMSDNGAKSLKIKSKDFEISIELDCGTAPVYVNGGVPSYTATPAPVPVVESTPEKQAPQMPQGNIVKSPIVGTFYAAASQTTSLL